jgi:hypothetical protein
MSGVDASSEETTGEIPRVELPGPRAVAAGIYGLIVSGSVMVAGVGYYTAPKLAVAVLVTVLVYWLAERYAELLAESVHGHRLTATRVVHTFREGWPMVQASYAPLAVFIVLYFFGVSVAQAVLAALVVSTGLLVALGAIGGHRAGLSRLGTVISALIAGVLGLIMVIFKFLLH